MQIRVRAWHKKQKKMYYPEELAADQLTLMPDGRGFINVHGGHTSRSRIYDHMVPLLSTGLTDKNGKEIYKGDIVVQDCYPFFDDEKPIYRAVVEWVFAGFHSVLRCIAVNRRGISDGINEPLEDGGDFEVIGNIYEHNHLLEKVA